MNNVLNGLNLLNKGFTIQVTLQTGENILITQILIEKNRKCTAEFK